jgi:hypothetical protein
MADQRVVRKSLAGQDDLLFGEGQEAQVRAGGNYNIQKNRVIYPVNSLAELNALDPEKFPKAQLYENDLVTSYLYNPSTEQYERIDFDIDYLIINDLSQAYIFDTVALYKASTIEFPVGKTIHLNDRNADFTIISGTGTANTFNVIANTTTSQSIDLIITSTSDLRNFGASSAASSEEVNTLALTTALSVSNGVVISGDYDINTMTVGFGKTLTFVTGGKLTVAANEVLTVLGIINADYDQWILDAIDEATNFSDPEGLIGPVENTATPIIIGTIDNSVYLETGMGKKVSVKWFGATGAGMKLDTYNDYFTDILLPPDQFINDTKAIRLALTALAKDAFAGSLAGSYAGSNILYFPAGMYCVDDDLYVSGGTTLIGDAPMRPNRATGILQTNHNKNLLVLQARGIGGLGGGGTSHVAKDLTLGYRACSVSIPEPIAIIKFVDNKFNLDSSFHNIRFSNCATHGAVVLVNSKEARSYLTPANDSNKDWGYGSESGLRVTAHFYDCMFDVAQGVSFDIAEDGNVEMELVDCQLFDQRDGFIHDAAKTTNAPEGGASIFTVKGTTFQGCGSPNNSTALYRAMIHCENSEAKYSLDNCDTSTYTDRVPKGGRIYMTAGKLLSVINSRLNNTEESAFCYAMELTGYIEKLKISDNVVTRMGVSSNSSIQFGSGYYGKSLSIVNNDFFCENLASNGHLFYNNPPNNIETFATLNGNTFSESPREALFGNPNPNTRIDGNFFGTLQSNKAISGVNVNMKGRASIYVAGIPTTGHGERGDIAIEAFPVAGGKASYICVATGDPGTWKPYGVIDA